MINISLVTLAILAAALAFYVLMLAFRIHNNVATGLAYRESLLSRLSELRLNNMINALGIDRERYAYQQSILDIDKQMKQCAQCGNTQSCDDHIAHGKTAIDDIAFCGNKTALDEILQQQTNTKAD